MTFELSTENSQPLPAWLKWQGETRPGLEDLESWVRDNRASMEATVLDSGALVIRGLMLESPRAFRDVCACYNPDLKNYAGGDSPRTGVADQVYTSTEYDADLEVLLHNELSYAGWCPERVFFGCLVAAESGGATTLADGRCIYRALDPAVRARFETLGITYLQHLWDEDVAPGPGKSWQETFETSSRMEAEDYLDRSGMTFTWTDQGIRTAALKPAVLVHPQTGENCWHNQADQWHRDMPSVKDSVSGTEQPDIDHRCGEETLGNHVVFGDGSEIPLEDLRHIREVSREMEVVNPWQNGDVVIIDNTSTMHGRKPFTGERQVLVAMA